MNKKDNLEIKSEVCPLLSSHCRRRIMVGLSEEGCMNGSYESCLTYKVVLSCAEEREPNYALSGVGRFKK
jgi:hypothetical protein